MAQQRRMKVRHLTHLEGLDSLGLSTSSVDSGLGLRLPSALAKDGRKS